MMNEVFIYRIPESWMNLGKTKKFYFDILEAVISIMISLPIPMIISFLLTKSTLHSYFICILIPYLLFVTFLRCHIKRDILYYLLLIAIGIGIYFSIPGTINKILALIYYFVYAVQSIRKRNSNLSYYNEGVLYFGYCVLAAGYLLCGFNKMNSIQIFIAVDALVFSLIFSIYIHIARTKKLMEWEKQTSKSDADKIKSASTNLIYYFIAIASALAVVFFCTGLFSPADFSYKVKPQQNVRTDNNEMPKVNVQNQTPSLEKMAANSKPPSKFMIYLGKTIEVIIGIIIAVMLIALVVMIIKAIIAKLKEIFYGRRTEVEEKESVFNIEDIKENITERINVIKKIRFSFSSTNNEKIRKAYYKFIDRYDRKSRKVTPGDTPYSIEKKVSEDMNVDISPVTKLYETARYSSGECSSEDVEEVKNFIRNFKKK